MRTRYALGQNMFTPLNKTLTNPSPLDRPYAGFMYGTVGLVGDSGTHLDQLQFTFGVVGPMSLAGETQNWVHGIVGDKKAKGWHYQLHNEPGLIIQYERSIKLIPPKSILGLIFDFEPHYGAAITFRSMRITYTYVIRSREYKTQPDVSKFGAIALSFRF